MLHKEFGKNQYSNWPAEVLNITIPTYDTEFVLCNACNCASKGLFGKKLTVLSGERSSNDYHSY